MDSNSVQVATTHWRMSLAHRLVCSTVLKLYIKTFAFLTFRVFWNQMGNKSVSRLEPKLNTCCGILSYDTVYSGRREHVRLQYVETNNLNLHIPEILEFYRQPWFTVLNYFLDVHFHKIFPNPSKSFQVSVSCKIPRTQEGRDIIRV
jgi:hypothetical protein